MVMKTKTKKIVVAALIAALACIATMIIKIPTPFKGYINLGDCIVLVAGWMLSPAYAFLAAGLGSAFADVFSGYATYAPATFVTKGLMALIAFYGFKLLNKRLGNAPSRIISGFISEAVMVLGYFVFEGFLYGFAPSVVNIPANAIQGVGNLILGVILIIAFEKRKIKLD